MVAPMYLMKPALVPPTHTLSPTLKLSLESPAPVVLEEREDEEELHQCVKMFTTDLAVFCSVLPASRSSWEPVAVAT